MAPILLYPDASELVCTFLRYELAIRSDAAHVGTLIPSPRPARMVIARRLGGARTTRVSDGADMAIECFAANDSDASDLARQCRGLVLSLEGTTQDTVPVYKVDEIAGPVDLPDPLSNQSRYTFSVSMSLRGVVDTFTSS